MQKILIQDRTYVFIRSKEDKNSFLVDRLGIPKSIETFVHPDLLLPNPKQLAHLQRRLANVGLSVDVLETKALMRWLFTSFAAFEDFVVYGHRSKTWFELEPIVTALIQLKVMDALLPEMTRGEAEETLKGKADYSFIIRLSTTYPKTFVVSVIKDDKFWHSLVTATLLGIHSWNPVGKEVHDYFFPSANPFNRKNSSTILVDVARFTASGKDANTVWETRLLSPITGEKIESKVWAQARIMKASETIASTRMFFDAPYGSSPTAGKIVDVEDQILQGMRKVVDSDERIPNSKLIPIGKVKMEPGRRVKDVTNGELAVIIKQHEEFPISMRFLIKYDDGTFARAKDEDDLLLWFEDAK
jgi:hypothetical protein